MNQLEQLRFLTPSQVDHIAERWGTPVFVYSEEALREQARQMLAFAAPYGVTVRYAMKANPARAILQIFNEMGLHIDASSGFEAWRAMHAGIAPERILLTSQLLADDFMELHNRGVQFNLSSLHQIEQWGALLPGTEVGVRINPGVGSGHSAHVTVGGPTSSFGIWHEYITKVNELASRYKLNIVRLHTHIGDGVDPAVWHQAARLSLEIIAHFPQAATLNLGGGFKIARTQDEKTTDLPAVSRTLAKDLEAFAHRTGRKLHLEIEPGTFMVATTGSLVTTVRDIVATGDEGFTFLKIDSGMTELMRPALYGAQHPIVVVNDRPQKMHEYVVVGRACESGDLLTPAAYQPGIIAPRRLQEAHIGDHLVIESVGAYGTAMNVSGYNSYTRAAEVLLRSVGKLVEIRSRQTLDELLANEESIPSAKPAGQVAITS
jgi:diaminopimelate decarboxylase